MPLESNHFTWRRIPRRTIPVWKSNCQRCSPAYTAAHRSFYKKSTSCHLFFKRGSSPPSLVWPKTRFLSCYGLLLRIGVILLEMRRKWWGIRPLLWIWGACWAMSLQTWRSICGNWWVFFCFLITLRSV